MLFVHPVFQFLAFILACYVFYLGLQRLRTLHLKHSVAFLWKRHVVLGLIALGTFLGGMIGGIIMVYMYWRNYFITGLHSRVAIVLVPLILFGVFSGLYMHLNKKKRKHLPILHAVNNAVLLFLSLVQIVTGWKILSTYVLGQ